MKDSWTTAEKGVQAKSRIITRAGAVGNKPKIIIPIVIRARETIKSLRLPRELSQNMAGNVPTRKNRLTALSPRIAS